MLMKMEQMKGKKVDRSLPIRLRNRKSPRLQEATSPILQKSNQLLPVLQKVKKVKPIKRQWISTREVAQMTNGSSRSKNPSKISSKNNSLKTRNRKLIRRRANNSQ